MDLQIIHPESLNRLQCSRVIKHCVSDGSYPGPHTLHRPKKGGRQVVIPLQTTLAPHELQHPIPEVAVVQKTTEQGILQVHVRVNKPGHEDSMVKVGHLLTGVPLPSS